MTTIVLDAGHGGNDLGDAYGYRFEKDDNLRLTLAVGDELKDLGYKVVYTRTNDIYVSQNDRVNLANISDGDYYLSIHRIIGELLVSEAGLGFYVDTLGGVAEEAAVNIAEELRPLGFENYSILVRTEYIRDAKMPYLIMGIGHLNSDFDNLLFDTNLEQIAQAISRGIYETIPPVMNLEDSKNSVAKGVTTEEHKPLNKLYAVQVGLFSDYSYAVQLHNDLMNLGYKSQIVNKDPYHIVLVGANKNLDYIASLEFCLRQNGYSTIIVTI